MKNDPSSLASDIRRVLGLCLVTLIAFGTLFAASLAPLGGNVKLAFDPSTTPGVTNYVLYASTNALTATNLATAVTNISLGTNLSVRVDGLRPGKWWFATTAVKDGVESVASNILPLEVPQSPAVMRSLAIQYNATLTGTNWQDAGWFRLKIEP